MPKQEIIEITFEEYLLSKTTKPDGEGGCWEWTGSQSNGYGKISNHMVHRLTYKYYVDPNLPDELVVRHKCDNPPCWNPSHLEPGTHKDNAMDKAKRGRHGNAKLTAEIVSDMRSTFLSGGVTQKDLAKRYGVQQSTVSRALYGDLWEHVTVPPLKKAPKIVIKDLNI